MVKLCYMCKSNAFDEVYKRAKKKGKEQESFVICASVKL